MCGHEGVLTPELEDDPDPRGECGEMAPDTSPKEGFPCSESRQLISPGLHSIKTLLASQILFLRRRYFCFLPPSCPPACHDVRLHGIEEARRVCPHCRTSHES